MVPYSMAARLCCAYSAAAYAAWNTSDAIMLLASAAPPAWLIAAACVRVNPMSYHESIADGGMYS
jgi:hypothetical protein